MEFTLHKNLVPSESPADLALILICEKCGKKLESKSDGNPGEDLYSELKDQSKKLLGKGQIRTVFTSCMDLCPKGEVAIGIMEADRSEFYTVSGNMKKIAENLIEKLTYGTTKGNS